MNRLRFVFLLILLTVGCIFVISVIGQVNNKFKLIDLPSELLPFYFSFAFNKEELLSLQNDCEQDDSCPYKPYLDKDVCWGFEDNCTTSGPSSPYSRPICDGDHKGWVKTKKEQVNTFFRQGDFGYIRHYRNSIRTICEGEAWEDSSLECSESLTFCRGRNIMINFQGLLNRTKPIMYDVDVLKHGDIGGFCKLHNKRLKEEIGDERSRMSSLQSWTPEIANFVSFPKRPLQPKEDENLCDRVVKTPTFIMKIDATVNMYHHFCDFLNLYASLFLNATEESSKNVFSKDVRILIWRTYPYQSNFEAAFRPFTSSPLWDLNDMKGKRVCFQNVVFPLPPRMIFGLFYNTPLVWGCRNSGLFHSFSKFMLHRLRISDVAHDLSPQYIGRSRKNDAIKVTLLSRGARHRNILNEDELLERIQLEGTKREHSVDPISKVVVRKVTFTWSMDFVDQLSIIHDTDILIGMHGAGLTHMLFLPDWAAVFEIYNCEDPHCYSDLARLRGLKYVTWRNESKLVRVDVTDERARHDMDAIGDHPKHANYIFDSDEFFSLFQEALQHVFHHKNTHLNINDITKPKEHDEL